MSVEFRQRTPSEFLKIASKRKWLIILPAIAIAASVAWVVYRLPDVYLSSTLIVVKASTLPTNVVPTMTDDNLTRQLTSIAQVVTSRSSLEPLVAKYDLYREERQRGEPMENVIALMRKSIDVEVNTSREITNGFNISYRGRDPRSTQAVTAELAGKYINEQTRTTSSAGNSAKEFMEQQARQAKEELDAIDKQRLDFMEKNRGNLPQEEASLLGQLGGLREQQKALIAEVGRLQDRRSALTNSLSLVKKQTENNREDVAYNTTDPRTTLAWGGLVQRKAALESELQRLRGELRDKHPDVQAKQAEVDSVKRDMDDMITDWKQRIKEKEEKLAKRPDLMASDLEGQIKLTEGEIKREQDMLGTNEKQISDIMGRLNEVPGVSVGLGALDREYQFKKATYDQLLAQQNKIALSTDALNQQQGEGIEVVDPANLPSLPVAPKRWTLTGMGLALGLAVGFLLAGVFEVPKLLTIQTGNDAAHYTGLPLLVSVPELLSPQEVVARPLRRRMLLTIAVVVTAITIPALALALRATHLFEKLVT